MYVVREMFAVKIFLRMSQTTKIKHAKIKLITRKFREPQKFLTQTFISQKFWHAKISRITVYTYKGKDFMVPKPYLINSTICTLLERGT